jgi:hypothetical protein
LGTNTHIPSERDLDNLSDEQKEEYGKLSPLTFLQRYGKLPSSQDESDDSYTDDPEGPWENGEHLPDEKEPGLRSMDAKGRANDNSGDGNEPTSHVSQAARIDSKKRKTVSQAVNPSEDCPSPEELQEDDSFEHTTPEKGPDEPDANDRSDEEIAAEYREKYGHHDSFAA